MYHQFPITLNQELSRKFEKWCEFSKCFREKLCKKNLSKKDTCLCIETAVTLTFNSGGQVRSYRGHIDSTVTELTFFWGGGIQENHPPSIKTKAQPCTKMTIILNTLWKINYFCFRILNTISNSFQNSTSTS